MITRAIVVDGCPRILPISTRVDIPGFGRPEAAFHEDYATAFNTTTRATTTSTVVTALALLRQIDFAHGLILNPFRV